MPERHEPALGRNIANRLDPVVILSTTWAGPWTHRVRSGNDRLVRGPRPRRGWRVPLEHPVEQVTGADRLQ